MICIRFLKSRSNKTLVTDTHVQTATDIALTRVSGRGIQVASEGGRLELIWIPRN